MKRLLALVLSGLIVVTLCSSWGFFAHYRINRLAVFTLPKSMAGFYRANINFITEHAVSADKKRYVDSTEAPHHFFNADHYGKQPFRDVPQRWIGAAAKYTSDTLNKYGTVPWAIQSNYYWLVKAFKARDTMAILISSANLAHYISDAHTPLHLTQNYDGQLTNQQGIHSLWESRLPELFSNNYNYNVGKAKYISNPLAEAFKICRASFKSIDTVLRVERVLNKTFPPAQKYTMEQRGNRKVKAYAVAYSRAYHRLLRGMVQRQMRASILSVGSYWFSAWVDAGQPDLDKLILKPLTKEEKQKIDKEEALYKAGKVYTGL
ncbi:MULTISPECIES: zinc dependent phospholipase C family protein [unclassified Mucilaginibacter]|uniref:zinc dependent phospholipase C family protein n=1 Tax=unclassified Mucilaginibacter TaxID=2617802 RepID=UPI002AC9C21F|nr:MULTISPECIES: zinc dependent phospholipase C family protein [unclassified Mucilaginibacter]MEB0248970.1 zinc dependent phospholipase C family protein [Mucilaginibacter sp. 5B2]MEB0262406.1 zinc dependent phospholipase C family protein [Mucilaginibacter sp. 10I4]MEB0277937.1 zinc dependent phospholipase C family protein [Mucilaginibacter sp. 10B2]MEB0299710.1 zinc dependent phospholipase C family protein [Mucilaginibacter sp. 5C4]WPX22828.1 zinc dependent phospholipase C family protein [Muci